MPKNSASTGPHGPAARTATAQETVITRRHATRVLAFAFALATLALTVAALCAAPAVRAADRTATGKPSTAGLRLIDADGRTLSLRGIDVMPVWPELPGRTWFPESYRQIADAGLNTVHFVLFWSAFEPSPGTWDATALATLDRAVYDASRHGLKDVLRPVTLSLEPNHHLPSWPRTGDEWRNVERHSLPFLTMIARRYRSDAGVVVYSLPNEPRVWPVDQDRILRFYDRAIRAIRAVDRSTVVSVSPDFGNSSWDPAFADLGLLTDRRNVVIEIHDYYAGGAGAGFARDDGRAAGAWTWDGMAGYLTVGGRRDIDRHVAAWARVGRRAGLPVFVGEWGINPQAPNAAGWIDQHVAAYKRHGVVGWTWWIYNLGAGLNALDESGRWRIPVERMR